MISIPQIYLSLAPVANASEKSAVCHSDKLKSVFLPIEQSTSLVGH